METVFCDLDMTSVVLCNMCDAYTNPARQTFSSTNPAHHAVTLRRTLCEIVSALCMSSQTSKLMLQASRTALDSILEVVSRQFATMRQDVLSWMASEPTLYEGINVDPTIPRSEAIRVFPKTAEGNLALEAMRLCFEVPLDTCGGGSMPIGCIDGTQGVPALQFLSQLRIAGHWLRTWVHELTWVDAPTHNCEALWLALNRGCAVCGTQCVCQGNRIDLINAEYSDDQVKHAQAMGVTNILPGPSKSPRVSLNAFVEIPWDLKPVEERLFFEDVPSDPVPFLARRILPYTHRSHMVTLCLRNGRRKSGESRFESYKAVFVGRLGTFDAKTFDKTEAELVLSNVMAALHETTPDGRLRRGKWVKNIFKARLESIHSSGLYRHMLTNVDKSKLREVCYPFEFEATLPLLPMHGHPEGHCWMSVLNLDKAQFYKCAWVGQMQSSPPVDTNVVETWCAHTTRHMVAFLSERLPRSSSAAFYRFGEINMLEPGQAESLRKIEDLHSTYTSHILNHVEHEELVIPTGLLGYLGVAVHENERLFETWPRCNDLAVLNTSTDTSVCTRILNGQSCHDAEYEQMLAHFVRLDSVLGPAWRMSSLRLRHDALHTTGDGMGLQGHLLTILNRYLKATPHLAPAPLLMRHSSSMPPGPRHPDVLLRWFLHGITASRHRTRGAVVEVELQNVFVLDASVQDGARVNRDNVGVHLSLYVQTSSQPRAGFCDASPVHLRLSMGISVATLDALTVESLVPVRLRDPCEGPAPLASWMSHAKKSCAGMTVQGANSAIAGLDLLGRLLDCKWTPVVQPHGGEPLGSWTLGWNALEQMCYEKCEWFASVASATPFCQWRGLETCACVKTCVFV